MGKIRLILGLFILLFITTILGCNNISNKSQRIKSGNDINLYIATDLHHLSDKLTDHGGAYKKYIASGDGKQFEYMEEIWNAFSYKMKQTKPDILIISGDLTNNGEKTSHLEVSDKLKKVEKSGTRVYVIPGNHDIENPWARKFKGSKQYTTEHITAEEFTKLYSSFGYEEAISKDEATLSYLAAPSEDLWLLMLDTNQYQNNLSNGLPQADGIIAKSTYEWIIQCSQLAKEKGAAIIAVMHHNILNHSEVIREGFTLNNYEQIRNIFIENKINLVLSGHIHIQDISSEKKSDIQLFDIATGSLSVYPNNYGIIKYNAGDNSFDYSTARVDVEGWAKDTGANDDDLLNYKSLSEYYFGKLSYDMAIKKLSENTDVSKEEINLMAETFKLLNLRYFSGSENLNSEDLIHSKGYQLWLNSKDSFLRNYVISISMDADTDDNRLHGGFLNK